MFDGCPFKDINLFNFNTGDMTDMSFIFNCCKSLRKINFDNFNTSKVTNMSFMFNG